MAQRAAVANGNWSLASTWNGGVIPSPGDVVASNGFTVTIDQNINVDLLTNAAVSIGSIVPVMTGYTTPSGIVSFSGEWSTGYPAWRAFDGVINAATVPYLAPSGPFWLSYEFTSAKAISSYWIPAPAAANFGNGASMLNWTFEAWNGSSWIVLDTVTNYLSTNWASGYTSPNFNNSTPYIKYRINCTAVNAGAPYATIVELRLYEYLSVSAVAGGGFTLNSGVTVTCTNTGDGITSATGTCITYSGTGISTINANILGSTTGTAGCIGVRVTGTGVLNINGNLVGYRTASGSNIRALSIEANATVNLTGNISTPNAYTVYIASQCIFNIVGNVYVGTYNTTTTIYCTGTNAIINLTGNIYGQGGVSGWTMTGIYLGAICTLNVTGNLIGINNDSRSHYLISVGANATVNITGTMQSGINGVSDYGEICFYSTVSSYLSHTGSIIASLSGYALISTGSGAINIFSGPFISSTSGMQPFYVTRMHYKRTIGSYYEFRDNSTNGALPPVAAAPTTRLNSPEVGSDLPAVANVRFGTTYGYGSLTGTLRMPHPNQVTYGVAVDNTFGTAVLTAASVWDYLVANITVENSIGMRLKNVATPQTTGSQLAALL